MESSDLEQQQRYSPLQDPYQQRPIFQHHPKPQFNNTSSSGLTRFRSAPSSYFDSLLDSSVPGATATAASMNSDDFLFPRPLSPETENIISRFINSVAGGSPGSDVEPSLNKLCGDVAMGQTVVKHEKEEQPIQQGIEAGSSIHENKSLSRDNPDPSSSSSPIIYRAPPSSNKPPLARGGHHRTGSGMDRLLSPGVMKTGFGGGIGGGGGGLSRSNRSSSSSLVRHSSSPAGLFDDIHIENGYLMPPSSGKQPTNYRNTVGSSPSPFIASTQSTIGSGGGAGGHGVGGSGGGERINSQTPNLPLGPVPLPPPSSSVMPSNPADHDTLKKRLKTETDEGNYLTGFPVGSWDETSMFSDLFPGGSEREIGGGAGEVSNPPSENQLSPGKGGGHRNNLPTGLLCHHMSLPKATLEKLLQFEDSVPCKIRAKRGCATHPRSIAERVRRTKISERMRKLQDLVPNMDKQTSTADMLDLAVEHIKDLQNQVQMLNGKRARCTCPSW